MQYRINPKNGNKLSALGFGCMRFPGKRGKVDVEETVALLRSAFGRGVNYFDTAFIYHRGKSESILGRALSDIPRDQYFIADKLPHYMVGSNDAIDRTFRTQLDRLRTGYIDYYLIHMLSDTVAWERLKSMGIVEWIAARKQSGEIKNIGFSFHGAPGQFIKLIDAYSWDFCQIQYNYMDTGTQAGTAGLEYAAAKGLPVIVMEPLRGGRLASSLPYDAERLFISNVPRHSPAEWGLRFVWDRPEITVVLSGMNTMEQLNENIRVSETALPGEMTENDHAVIQRVKEIIGKAAAVPCTGCGYCMPCPFGVDIPGCFAAYNEKRISSRFRVQFRYLRNTGAFTASPASASVCRDCGRCAPHCPQSIPIPEKLDMIAGKFEGAGIRIVLKAYRRVMKRKDTGGKSSRS